MKGLVLTILAMVVAVAAATVFQGNRSPSVTGPHDNVKQITDGAFRDGLYLGRLASERGLPHRIAAGRWATAENRASFTAGYERGYNEFLASRMAPATRVGHPSRF
jgi:hypothetical protein